MTNVIQQTDVGDLVSSLTFNNITAVLMNHDSPNTSGHFLFVYDDSGTVDPAITPLPPATLCNIPTGRAVCRILSARMSHPACGCSIWRTASRRSPATCINFNLRIHPQLPATSGETNTIPGHGVSGLCGYVPAGATNLTINATNITSSPDTANPLLMVHQIRLGADADECGQRAGAADQWRWDRRVEAGPAWAIRFPSAQPTCRPSSRAAITLTSRIKARQRRRVCHRGDPAAESNPADLRLPPSGSDADSG